jgi:uncharacterized protein (DUF1778 family)
MSHIIHPSLPDDVYDVIDKAAKSKGLKVNDYIIDAAMMSACGKSKLQFIEENRKR